ncbi:MAG: efflux RND transporter periplasmic adaptor subunit [Lentisphaeria bacterium]|nr:efflux RND transporter periplasmic adaptor subunit [Lentisphaeria bacterium]
MKNYHFMRKIVGLLLISGVLGCSEEADNKELTEIAPITVEVGTLKQMTFQKSILVQGNIQAIDDAVISARVAGTIEQLNVSEGDKVKKGEILFQTDRKNLENHLLVAEQSLAVAVENCKTVEQDIQIAETNLHKAALDYERAKKLVKSKVISQTAFEDSEAEWKRKMATLAKEKTVLDYSKVKVEQARTNLQIARKNLEDSIIKAPFDGVITDKFQEQGEYVGAGTKVLMMENTGNLEVSAEISSVYYDLINKDTKLIISSDGRELAESRVTYIAPTINPVSRTFEIKAKLPENPNLICGSLCDIKIILAERDGFGIISNALLERSGGRSSIFVVRDGKAEELGVKSGFTTDGYTEILDAKKIGDEKIVVTGQYFLNNGDKVVIK